MKATREQVTEMLKQAGMFEPGWWLVDGNKYEALVHLAQQFTLDQLRRGEVIHIAVTGRGLNGNQIENCPFYKVPETLE